MVSPSERPRILAAAAVDPKGTHTPVGSKPSYSASPRFSRTASSVPTATAARKSAPLTPPTTSAAASAADTHGRARVRAGGHGVLIVEGPRHHRVGKSGLLGRHLVPMDQDGRLRLPSQLPSHLDDRLAAFCPGPGDGRSQNAAHHVSHSLERGGRYVTKGGLADESRDLLLCGHRPAPFSAHDTTPRAAL